jgi:hypothetical protein
MMFLWFFTAQWCSMLVDRVHTAPMAVVQSSPFGWNGTYLQFGSAIPGLVGLQGFNRGELLTGAHLLELTGPGPDYKQAATLEINANNQLILVAGGRSDDEPIPAFAAEPGDTTSVTLERSLLGRPAPFSLAGTYFERADDDLATRSLLSVILDKGLGRTPRYGLASRARVRGD